MDADKMTDDELAYRNALLFAAGLERNDARWLTVSEAREYARDRGAKLDEATRKRIADAVAADLSAPSL